jgi:hypothetical protein
MLGIVLDFYWPHSDPDSDPDIVRTFLLLDLMSPLSHTSFIFSTCALAVYCFSCFDLGFKTNRELVALELGCMTR